MIDRFSKMDRSEVDHEARINEAMAIGLLQVAYEYSLDGMLDFDQFMTDATVKSDCDILSLWTEVRVASEEEILERVETEFTEAEVEHIKSLIAAGKL